jgi:hypothetical protein
MKFCSIKALPQCNQHDMVLLTLSVPEVRNAYLATRFSVGGFPCAVSEKKEKKEKKSFGGKKKRITRRRRARRFAERLVCLYASQLAWFR